MYMNISYKQIPKKDSAKVKNLINEVYNNLKNKDFFIPIEDSEFKDFWDKDIGVVFGAYDNEKLVAIAKLDINDKYLYELKNILNFENIKIAEMGRYLVLEEYRNKGIMYQLEKIMIEFCKTNNYQYVIATVHPDNIPSNKTIMKVGLKLEKKVLLNNGFYRNIYVLKL